MTLAVSDLRPIEVAPLPEARLELVPLRGEVEAVQHAPAAARLDIVPQPGSQPRPPRTDPTAVAGLVVAAGILHIGFAVLFGELLDWRVVEQPIERDIPVEVVARMPARAKPPGPAMPKTSASSGTGPGEPPDPSPLAPPKPATPPPPPLVAPPPEPKRAASQAEQNKPADIAPEPPKPIRPEVAPPPVQVPEALASTRGDSSVAQAAKTKPDPAPRPKPSPPKPDAPADLDAALPMDLSGLPTSFRSVLSGSGTQAGVDYKGLVFARLGRSQGATERARAQHLRGQAIVSFTVDDQGRVVDLKIAASSGTPTLDAIALDMIREAAPFPPPPPGTPRTFTPALSFGDE